MCNPEYFIGLIYNSESHFELSQVVSSFKDNEDQGLRINTTLASI